MQLETGRRALHAIQFSGKSSRTESTCFQTQNQSDFVNQREFRFVTKIVGIIGSATLFLTACGDVQSRSSDAFITELPESLLAIVAPNQDLNTVRIDPSDGCYVYRYVGPVETTFLPLRSVRGRPICTRQPDVVKTS